MEENTVIRSRENAQVKQLHALLTQKKKRDEAGLFVLEGIRLCIDALESGLVPESLYITPHAMEHYREAASRLASSAQRTYVIDEALASRVSDTKTPQGVFCVIQRIDAAVSDVKPEKNGRYVILSGLQDPGNLGGILRTAQALGVSGVFLHACPDLYAPKVLRAAMGGVFRLPVKLLDNPFETIAQLREAGVEVYAAALDERAIPLGAQELGAGTAVLIGNEGNGLPPELVQACSGSVLIPMAGGAQSLNAGVAAGILIWEMTKLREGLL